MIEINDKDKKMKKVRNKKLEIEKKIEIKERIMNKNWNKDWDRRKN